MPARSHARTHTHTQGQTDLPNHYAWFKTIIDTFRQLLYSCVRYVYARHYVQMHTCKMADSCHALSKSAATRYIQLNMQFLLPVSDEQFVCTAKTIYHTHTRVFHKDIITCKLIPISNGSRKVCAATLWDFSILETCSASKTVIREIGCNQRYFEMQVFRTDCIISVHGKASRKLQNQSYKNRSFSSISSTNSEQNYSPQKPK